MGDLRQRMLLAWAQELQKDEKYEFLARSQDPR
jgi:hypothetical protein